MQKCKNTKKIVVFGTNEHQKTALLFNPRCKSWNCDYCAEMNKEHWIHQTARGSQIITMEGRELQFVTLTSRHYATPTKSIYFFQQNWPKLRKRMAGRTNQWRGHQNIEWAYMLIPERHKSGVLHAHLLAATHISSKRIWKDAAFQSGFGYQIKIDEVVTPLLAADYVAKYLHKGEGAEDWPKGFRRVRHSQNWPMSTEKPLPGWDWKSYLSEETIWQEKHALLDMGWEVIDKRE